MYHLFFLLLGCRFPSVSGSLSLFNILSISPQLQDQSVMEEYEFLKPESRYAIVARRFPVWNFFLYYSYQTQVYIVSGTFFKSFWFFFMLFIHSAFLQKFFFFYIFYSKSVLFLLYPVVGLSLHFHRQLVGRILFSYFEMFRLLVLPYPVTVSLEYPFFRQYIFIRFFLLRCQTFWELFITLSSCVFYLPK